MPTVVKTAIVEQPMSSHSITRSTLFRARSSGLMRPRSRTMATTAMTRISTVSAMRLMPRSRVYSAAAPRTASLTVFGRHVAGDEVADIVHDQRQLVGRQITHTRRVGDR